MTLPQSKAFIYSPFIHSRRQSEAWLDLQTSRQMKVASSLMASLQENAFLLADVARDDEYMEEATREIGQ